MSRIAIRGTTKLLRHDTPPAILATANATEIAAATDYTGVPSGEDAESLNNFDAANATIATQGMSTQTDTQVGGTTTLGSPEILYYLDDTTNAIYDDLDIGDIFGLSLHPFGIGLGKRYTYYQVTCVSKNVDYSGDVPRWRAGFAQNAIPVEGSQIADV